LLASVAGYDLLQRVRHGSVELGEAARLKAAGPPLKRIASMIGTERKTLRRWFRAGGDPLWRHPRRVGILGPYAGYLARRWLRPKQDTAAKFHAARTQAFATWTEITDVAMAA
jgi:hypothetical protein